jgi:hypothetical protein
MISLNGRPDSGLSNAATTGSLRDPGGPRAGSTAPPSFAELRNPTLSNSKITYDSNTTASLPLLVRPWSQGFENGFRQGSVLFVSDEDCNQQMCSAADIPTLNYILENAAMGVGAARKMDEKLLPKVNDLDSLLGKYKFFGVLRNDMMANSMLQRLYNCDVYGRSMIANIFGDKLKRGDNVGLAIVSLKLREKYNMFVQPNGSLLPPQLTDPMLVASGGKCLQVCGMLNGKPVGLDGEVVHRIPIGVVSHAVAKVPSKSFVLRALRESDQYTLLPRIEILLI